MAVLKSTRDHPSKSSSATAAITSAQSSTNAALPESPIDWQRLLLAVQQQPDYNGLRLLTIWIHADTAAAYAQVRVHFVFPPIVAYRGNFYIFINTEFLNLCKVVRAHAGRGAAVGRARGPRYSAHVGQLHRQPAAPSVSRPAIYRLFGLYLRAGAAAAGGHQAAPRSPIDQGVCLLFLCDCKSYSLIKING